MIDLCLLNNQEFVVGLLVDLSKAIEHLSHTDVQTRLVKIRVLQALQSNNNNTLAIVEQSQKDDIRAAVYEKLLLQIGGPALLVQ